MFNRTSANKHIAAGFFGKLPGFPDFIKHNSAGKEILSIDTWIQEGLALAKLKIKNNWKNYYNNLPKMNFIYPFTGTDNIILGSIVSSGDKSGRSYPFIMFSLINKSLIAGSSQFLIPYDCKEIFFGFEKIISENLTAVDTANLKSSVENLSISIPDSVNISSDNKNFLSTFKLVNVFELEEDKEILISDLFEKHIKVFDHFISLEYKLYPDKQNEFFLIGFFVDLIKVIFKNHNSIPLVFWYQVKENSGSVLISFTKPTAKDFVDLLLLNTSENGLEFKTAKSLIRENSFIKTNFTLTDFLNSVKTSLN